MGVCNINVSESVSIIHDLEFNAVYKFPDVNIHMGVTAFSRKLYLDKSPIKGCGVFAKKKICKGDTILVFRGKFATKDDLQKRSKYCLQIAKGRWLLVLGPERYVNHSCSPNAGIIGNVRLVAIKNIRPNEEIVFDYAMAEDKMRMKCKCGSEDCRKFISGLDALPVKKKKQYRNYIASHLK